MKLTKRIVAFNNTSGVGLTVDSRGRVKVLANKKNSKPLRTGMSILTVNTATKGIVK